MSQPKADSANREAMYGLYETQGMLYGVLFEAIADQDINRIVAGIAQPNAVSNALHRRFGFTTIGTYSQVGRKFGKYWDVMWVERPLKL